MTPPTHTKKKRCEKTFVEGLTVFCVQNVLTDSEVVLFQGVEMTAVSNYTYMECYN